MLKNTITFLGTGGGRVVVFRQLRHSGGMWLNLEGINILIDPGPGSLVRIFEKGFDTRDIDIIVVSHRHLDHSSDLNAVLESATESTKKPIEMLVAPEDVISGEEPILLKYLRKSVKNFAIAKEGKSFNFKNILIEIKLKHIHKGAQTYGLEFSSKNKKISYVPCGKFFEDMLTGYSKGADLMIFNTTFVKPKQNIQHLSAEDVLKMLKVYQPKKAVITHFSLEMLKSNPKAIASWLGRESGNRVFAAEDGMRVSF
ncbi:MAG: MBL fold metallo-hydrolase [Aquificae bacterium]|nr:MBL fold metallo-hydrolase [Aquificota bacterium]